MNGETVILHVDVLYCMKNIPCPVSSIPRQMVFHIRYQVQEQQGREIEIPRPLGIPKGGSTDSSTVSVVFTPTANRQPF